jgi:hypothetical protein
MSVPKWPTQMCELLKQYPRTDPLQPLPDLADLLRRPTVDGHRDVIRSHLARHHFKLMRKGNLAQPIPSTYRNRPRRRLPVFRPQTQ